MPRGWRLCISGCPYKKIYFNWKWQSQKNVSSVIRAIQSGQPTVCQKLCGWLSVFWACCFTTPTALRKRQYRARS
ncbi:4Fe-4S dicluster domain-containing protein [Escherichia coli]